MDPDEFSWSEWIEHDDCGWPKGVEPDEVVWPEINGDVLSPMPAHNLDWYFPNDPVTRYRRRIWKHYRQIDFVQEALKA